LTIQINILKSALVFGALFLLSAVSFSQEDALELLPGSEVLKFNEETGVHRLLGNVNFKYQGNLMFCDSAHYHQRSKTVRAYGHVHINKRDTLNLFCDSLFYDGRTRKAKLWGNVRVRDSEYKLTTDTLDYDARASRASYHYGGRVESTLSKEVLTSRAGYLYPNSKDFFFRGDVRYEGNDLEMETDTLQYTYGKKTAYFFGPTSILSDGTSIYCESGSYSTQTKEGELYGSASIVQGSEYIVGDTLLYRPEQGESIGIGNVLYYDTTQAIAFSGNYAYTSDSLNYSFLTGRALATKEMKDDTLYIHADTLFMEKIDTTDIVKAYKNARIYSTKIQGRADSIVYAMDKERIELFFSPIIWSNAAELKGDFMDVHITDSSIHKINIYDNSTILMEVQSEKYYNQIAGKNINAYFKQNELRRAIVNGNAMTVFFPEDEIKTDSLITKKRMGMNRLYASDLRIDIDSNELTGITYQEAPDGAFYPIDQIKEAEQFVPGFNWKSILRPKDLEDLFE